MPPILYRGPKNYGTPIAVSLTSALNLVSRCHTSIKETRTLLRIVASRTGPGKVPDEPGTSCGARNWESKSEGNMLKRHRSS